MPRSFLVKKTDKQKDRHEKHSQKESSNPVPRETPPVQDSREVKDDHVTEVQDFQEALRPAVIVETRQRIEDEYKRVEITDDQQSLHSPSTDEGYSESPLHRHSPAHGVNRQGSVSPTYSPHMTPPPRDVYTEARSPTPPSRIQYVGSEIEVCSEPDRHQDRHDDRHHDSHQDRHLERHEDRESDRESGLSSPHDVYSLSHHYQHEFQHAENRDSMRHVSNSHRHEQYRNASMSPHRMDYHHQESNPRHMDTFYERYSRHDSFQGDYGRSEASHRHREEHFGRADSPARSRSPLDLTVRSNVEPVASAVAPYTPAIPNLSARLSNGYLRDALATSFYRALTTDMVPSDGSGHHGYPSSYTSSPSSSSSGGRLTPQGLPGYVTSPSRASISSMSPTSPQKAQMSPLCTSVAPSPTPSPALSIQSDSDESIYSASGRKIDRKSAGTTFQDGVTVGYTYDAFFVSDGRSRRKNSMGIPEKSRPRYTCNECGKHYATSSNLSRHKQTHRSVDSKLAKKCPHCTKVYVSMPALSMHILTHELKHKCMVCNKSFSRPWLLQGHMRSHTGDKPYGCAHCGKAFADRSNLRAHMQTHSSFKHYECKRCNKSFALKSYLNKHYESACFKDS